MEDHCCTSRWSKCLVRGNRWVPVAGSSERHRETLLFAVINNILPPWCCSSSSYQRCAVSFQELPKLSGPHQGAHRRVGLAFRAALSLGCRSGTGFAPALLRLARQNLPTVQCQLAPAGLGCVPPWSWACGWEWRAGLLVSLGCLLLWVPEMAVCTIPILKCCPKRDWICSEREQEGSGGRAETKRLNMRLE